MKIAPLAGTGVAYTELPRLDSAINFLCSACAFVFALFVALLVDDEFSVDVVVVLSKLFTAANEDVDVCFFMLSMFLSLPVAAAEELEAAS